MVTTMDRGGMVSTMYLELMNVTEDENDYALLALASFWEVVWFNRQTS